MSNINLFSIHIPISDFQFALISVQAVRFSKVVIGHQIQMQLRVLEKLLGSTGTQESFLQPSIAWADANTKEFERLSEDIIKLLCCRGFLSSGQGVRDMSLAGS